MAPYEATAKLMNAVQFGGSAEDVKSLLANGADANAKLSTGGWSALQLAVKRGDIKIVAPLIDVGANVDATNDWGVTALNSAAFRGFTDIARLLLAKGADPNINCNSGPALSTAAENGFTNVVLLLLDHGTQMNQTNWSGDSPLLVATAKNHTAVARLLIERGANVNLENMDHNNALDAAIKNKNAELVQLLRKAGAVTSRGTKLDEDLARSLKEGEDAYAALSNAVRGLPTPAATTPSLLKPVAPAFDFGTNADKNGYVKNPELLKPFTLMNSAGITYTDAVMVKFMKDKVMYKTSSGSMGTLPIEHLPVDYLKILGWKLEAEQP